MICNATVNQSLSVRETLLHQDELLLVYVSDLQRVLQTRPLPAGDQQFRLDEFPETELLLLKFRGFHGVEQNS